MTRRLARYGLGELEVVDMPGFGFMTGLSRAEQEEIKTQIVRYLERNRKKILIGIQVIDARAFGEIVDRWSRRGQIPVDVEMFQFLRELGLNPILVANKIDLIYPEERDAVLDDICDKLGFSPPWRQWPDVVVPISAKTGEGIETLRGLVKRRMRELGYQRLIKYLK